MSPTEHGGQPQTVALNEIGFLRKFIRHLAGTLEEVVGLHEARGFISTVAQKIGEQINETYKQSMGVERLNRGNVCKVITDLQKRINGGFEIAEETDEKIVISGCACPFGKDVADRPSLCMMTSSLLGVIAAENLGYAKVSIEESIAQGDQECRIVMYLQNTSEAQAAEGQEFFQS